MTLNFESEKLVSELKKRKPKKVLVQLPEGIKQNVSDISKIIKESNLKDIEIIFSGESAWGGCSLAIEEAKSIGADLIIHFGHSPFLKTDFPVIYIEIRDELDLTNILKNSLKFIKKYNKIGISYSIQHKQDVDKIKEFYNKNGKKVFLSKKIGAISYEGQVIGCQYKGLKAIEEKVDCFLIIGNKFHSLGASLSVNKPVFLLDVYNDDIKDMEKEKNKILKQRAIAIEKFRESKNVGIIIETKLGQKFGSVEYLLEKLKNNGKETIIITMNEITPEKIMNFYNIDSFIELACPRIAIDDYEKYNKPVLTFKESLIGLGITSWEDAIKTGFI